MSNLNDLKAGFTGDIEDKQASVVEQAKTAARYVKKEANAVAAGAQDHPSGTGAVLLVFGAAAFLAGYLLGSTSTPPARSRYW